MNTFYNQSWFWVGFFTAIGSLGSVLIKEWITNKTQIKIERLKIYESDVFKAYMELYYFSSNRFRWFWPPDNPSGDFFEIMRNVYFKNVKSNILYYSSEIRDILGKLESQYNCIGDPDLIPEKPFDDFYNEDLFILLKRIDKSVEEWTDSILHKK